MPVKPITRPLRRALLPLALLLLLLGCGHDSLLLKPVPGPEIPPLPAAARQPEPPALCVPTCSAGLQTLLDSLLPSPTGPASPEMPVLGPTGR